MRKKKGREREGTVATRMEMVNIKMATLALPIFVLFPFIPLIFVLP